jgi:hypothetical protein
MDLANVARLAVIFYRGAVVGVGFAVLYNRARFYRRVRIGKAVAAMATLGTVNAAVMLYLALVMLDRWDDTLSWPWAGAVFIFTVKGVFFRLLHDAGIEQERRGVLGAQPVGVRAVQ